MGSPVRSEPVKFTVYPTGFDQLPWSDKHLHCVAYVERYPDTGKWRVHDGYMLLSKTGNWVYPRPQVRHLTRFDTAADAMAAAMEHVDSLPRLATLPAPAPTEPTERTAP